MIFSQEDNEKIKKFINLDGEHICKGLFENDQRSVAIFSLDFFLNRVTD